MANFNLDAYVTVNDRIVKFYGLYPEGSIQTEIVKDQDGQVVFKAYAYRTPDDLHPCTGHAMEKEGSSYINKTSHYENCETSAVGRALAMLGLEISKAVCSKEEVANARLNQDGDGNVRITDMQAKILQSLAQNRADEAKKILLGFGYTSSMHIQSKDYGPILQKFKEVFA